MQNYAVELRGYSPVPRLSFAHRFDTKLREMSFEKQNSAKARRNIFDLTQNSVVAVLTVSNLFMIRTYVFR